MAKKLGWIYSVPVVDKNKKTVGELAALQTTLDARERLVDMYSQEDISGHLMTGEMFDAAAMKTAPFPKQNIIDRAIRRLSLVFKDQPEYDYGEKAELPDWYDERRRWKFMKETERLGNLLGTLMVRPLVLQDDQGKFYMDYERLWLYIPFFADSQYTPEAVIYPITTPSDNMMLNLDVLWSYWSKEEAYIVNSKGVRQKDESNPEGKNAYGTLPWVSFHVRPQVKGYWTKGYGEPLADVNDHINVGLMEMRLGLRLNLLGQWYITGINDPKKAIKLGVNIAPQLPFGVELNCKTPQADMDGAISNLKMEIENTLQNVGLHVVWGEEGGVPSGESLKVKNIELLERREDDVAGQQTFDKSLYEKERLVAEKTPELKGNLPEDRGINYQEVEFPLHPQEQRDRDDWRLEKGVMSLVDIYLRDNPDAFSEIEDQEKRRQAIIDHIRQNQAENSEMKIRKGEPAAEASNIFERRESARQS